MKILVMGLPGAGKTTFTKAFAPFIYAVVFNADEVRGNLWPDLGYSHRDRVEQARRMGWLCDRVNAIGANVIADFVCPTARTRAIFNPEFIIWIDRIKAGRFDDTNQMFEPPQTYDIRLDKGTPAEWAKTAYKTLYRTVPPQIGPPDSHPISVRIPGLGE